MTRTVAQAAQATDRIETAYAALGREFTARTAEARALNGGRQSWAVSALAVLVALMILAVLCAGIGWVILHGVNPAP